MNYGLCQGGPFNKKHLADIGEVFPVWRHPTSLGIITGIQTSATWPPIGAYSFQDGTWIWTDEGSSKV